MSKCKHKFHFVKEFNIYDEDKYDYEMLVVKGVGYLFVCENCGLQKHVEGINK